MPEMEEQAADAEQEEEDALLPPAISSEIATEDAMLDEARGASTSAEATEGMDNIPGQSPRAQPCVPSDPPGLLARQHAADNAMGSHCMRLPLWRGQIPPRRARRLSFRPRRFSLL